MSMKDYSKKVLRSLDNDFKAARTRKRVIQEALGMLANAGVPDDVLAPLNAELELAEDEVKTIAVHRIMARDGARNHGWLD